MISLFDLNMLYVFKVCALTFYLKIKVIPKINKKFFWKKQYLISHMEYLIENVLKLCMMIHFQNKPASMAN